MSVKINKKKGTKPVIRDDAPEGNVKSKNVTGFRAKEYKNKQKGYSKAGELKGSTANTGYTTGSLGKVMINQMTSGHRKVREFQEENQIAKSQTFKQAERWERSKGISTGKSKLSAKLRFRKPVGKRSQITGVMTRGKQYRSKRA